MSHFTRDSYVPGPSKAEESDTDSNSQTSEEAKIHTIMETMAENIIVIEDDLILFEEADEEGLFEEVEDSGLQSDDEYHPDEKGRKLIRMTFRLIIK
ncbi:hypothetical protein TNCV_4782891 [Trichonephila clavipes]|nr:hypothetical protein TNCV_4782891 [Trichonephila clavipes]